MLAADIPVRFEQPFAFDCDPSDIRAVPLNPTTDGLASLTEGFPPVCFLPVGSGGVPPSGADFNGLFFQVSAWCRWLAAGGPTRYNAAFQTAISGYPKGTYIQSAVTDGLFWLSTVDGNTSDPDAAGAGWIGVSQARATRVIDAGGAFATAAADVTIGLKRSAATSTVLPISPFDGKQIYYEDIIGNLAQFNHTVTPGTGDTLVGNRANIVMNVNGQCSYFRYYATDKVWSWKP